MRLWDYRLLSYLPKSQLISQWRELNSIYKKQDKHILINYIYLYDKIDLYIYSNLVITEMFYRNYKIKSFENYNDYFKDLKVNLNNITTPFKNHHNNRYLLICFINLYEKKINKQKDFEDKCFNKMYDFVNQYYNLKEMGIEKYD